MTKVSSRALLVALAVGACDNSVSLEPDPPVGGAGGTGPGGMGRAGAAEASCASRFIKDFGLRAFRRPLAADEVTALEAVYAAARAGGDFTDGIRLLIAAMLQSPLFLYRWELGEAPMRDGDLVRFNAW